MNHEINNSRLSQLFSLLEAQPREAFLLYAIATEYKKAGQLESAILWYSKVLEVNANDLATYYHLGSTLYEHGQTDAAKKIFQQGIELARNAGDLKTLAELNNALLNAEIDD